MVVGLGCGDDTTMTPVPDCSCDAARLDARIDAQPDAPAIDAPMIDAPEPDAPMPDAAIDAPMIDAPPPDASPDAVGTCSIAAHCAPGESCNTSTHECETACGAGHTNCNGGCCDGSQCLGGLANGACGASGGMCSVCADRTPTCSAGFCSSACGAASDGTCANGFCCANGQCQDGTQQNHCGFSGSCTNCGVSSVGHRCLAPSGGPYTCGCTAAGDCRAANAGVGLPGQACNTTTSSCTNACNGANLTGCNGGCCGNEAGNFVCSVGNANNNCGTGGGLCTDCTLTSQTCILATCQ
jgi:hypothetical protein